MAVEIHPLTSEDGKRGVLVTGHDITRFRAAEATLCNLAEVQLRWAVLQRATVLALAALHDVEAHIPRRTALPVRKGGIYMDRAVCVRTFAHRNVSHALQGAGGRAASARAQLLEQHTPGGGAPAHRFAGPAPRERNPVSACKHALPPACGHTAIPQELCCVYPRGDMHACCAWGCMHACMRCWRLRCRLPAMPPPDGCCLFPLLACRLFMVRCGKAQPFIVKADGW